MSDMMTFPDTWEEFEKSYGFTDNEEVYTNGARLIPSFRVKQWLDHLLSVQQEQLDCEDCIKNGGDWECDRVHCHKGDVPDTNVGELISRRAAIDALDEIRHALWEIDIPSPTVPEYAEHHEQVQSVWKLLDKKQKELYVLPSVQPKERCIANITLNEEDLEKIVKEQVGEIKELLPEKGEWIWDDDIFDLEKEYICSECRCYALKKDRNQIRSNFCPNCGCDMREGD